MPAGKQLTEFHVMEKLVTNGIRNQLLVLLKKCIKNFRKVLAKALRQSRKLESEPVKVYNLTEKKTM